MSVLGRRQATLALLPLVGSLLGCGRSGGDGGERGREHAALPKVFRVVRPKQLTALSVLDKQGTLEKALAPLGVELRWLEFAAGPQQLEALNAGELDLAATAESPPVFSQSAGSPLVYLAKKAPSGRAVSCLVAPDSTIAKVADLKGKKVAFQKASIGHYLLVRALEREGLSLEDVTSVHLPPPDAQAAFSQRKVDAWLIWEPFGTRAVQSGTARVLFDGGELRDTSDVYTTHRKFYEQGRSILELFFAELKKAEAWSENNPREMAELLAKDLMIDVPTLLEMHKKYTFGVFRIDESSIQKQQQVADLFHSLRFLPQKIDVRPGFLSESEYASLVP